MLRQWMRGGDSRSQCGLLGYGGGLGYFGECRESRKQHKHCDHGGQLKYRAIRVS